MSISVIIAAAGTGSRMQSPVSKQFLVVQGKPILMLTAERFQECEAVDEIIIAAPADQMASINFLVKEFRLSKVAGVVAGGAYRQQSVTNALRELPAHSSITIVHDAVRPFVRKQMIVDSIALAEEHGASVVAVRVKDTIKQSQSDGVILRTLDRKDLWAAQTPQTFRTALLKEAYARAERDGFVGTDDAALVERMEIAPAIVEGSYDNIKITTPEDMEMAALIASRFLF